MGLLDRLSEERTQEEKAEAQKPKPALGGIGGAAGGLAKKVGLPAKGKGSEKLDPYEMLKDEIQARLIEDLDQSFLEMEDANEKRETLKQMVEDLMVKVATEKAVPYSAASHKAVVMDVLDDILGLGPIEEFFRLEEVSEVMVNGPKQVYIERNGKLELTDKQFRDNDHVMHIVEKIVAPLGRRCDESCPMVDARLKDGSRVNAIIPPLALNGPTITIRKFKKDKLQISDLVRFGTLTQKMADFIEACVKVRLNVVVSGGTGSGKTTTLNILSCFIPEDERIITCEDAAEIQLRQPHVVSLETRPPNIEGKGEVTMRELIKNTLRMRPERVIVGECRGGETLDMLQAMNTGHDGSLTTGHANTPRDMIARLETMVLMSGMELPVKAIREQISSAVDLIIQQSRLKDGSRKITHITEIQGMEGDIITMQDIFIFKQKGMDENGKIIGSLEPSGIRPKFMSKFASYGIHLPADLFMSAEAGW
ncbi:MAG: type II secretion system protein E [Candidatus Wallbacteria bacterium HGW-Wallbacteria-1]|jgi:pilus assembly protein CpaF|uniref:Type II secretion system protein E n=1 Tax=Candidatus Wallbacteria bacterium HGW-Wallbacteria-1 TaxID=2013854 RepID=A0A2N1PPX8_9BACT|nr:MAG: type II secretion system protein E [Candidatus Wallbacteria bacterium HGW-Wallbacteria-1]